MTLSRISTVMLNLVLLGTIGLAGPPFQNRGNSVNLGRAKPRIVITTDPAL